MVTFVVFAILISKLCLSLATQDSYLEQLVDVNGQYYTLKTKMETIRRTYIINLKRAPEKLQAFKSEYTYDFSDVTVFDAIDGQQVDITSEHVSRHIRAMYSYEHFWNRGVLGAALSHEAIWNRVANDEQLEENSRVAIFEPDIVFHPNFREIWREASSEFPDSMDHAWIGGRFHANHMPSPQKMKSFLRVGKHVYTSGREDRGAFGYIVTKRGAKRFLERLNKTNGFYRAVDHFMTDYIMQGKDSQWSYTILPLPIWHPLEAKSDIRKKACKNGGQIEYLDLTVLEDAIKKRNGATTQPV